MHHPGDEASTKWYRYTIPQYFIILILTLCCVNGAVLRTIDLRFRQRAHCMQRNESITCAAQRYFSAIINRKIASDCVAAMLFDRKHNAFQTG